MLRDELANGRDELERDFHSRVGGLLVRGLVFCDRLVLGLRLVVREDAADACLVPSRRKPALLAHCFLLRLRRSACFAFAGRSYAVITNTDIGSGSGT
jgi:hypothetical protein